MTTDTSMAAAIERDDEVTFELAVPIDMHPGRAAAAAEDMLTQVNATREAMGSVRLVLQKITLRAVPVTVTDEDRALLRLAKLLPECYFSSPEHVRAVFTPDAIRAMGIELDEERLPAIAEAVIRTRWNCGF